MKFVFLSLFLLFVQSHEPSLDDLLGKVSPGSDPTFLKISDSFARGDQYLRKEASLAFEEMARAALKDGVKIIAISTTRNFNRQKQIWNAKWTGKRLVQGKNLAETSLSDSAKAMEILKYSSMPGTSRHHWGSDVDINALENDWFEAGEGKKIYEWMQKHAEEYGFCQPYTSKECGRTGYEEEKWHWSYEPISKPYLEAYLSKVKTEMITGFEGAHTAKEVQVIENYVQGITHCNLHEN